VTSIDLGEPSWRQVQPQNNRGELLGRKCLCALMPEQLEHSGITVCQCTATGKNQTSANRTPSIHSNNGLRPHSLYKAIVTSMSRHSPAMPAPRQVSRLHVGPACSHGFTCLPIQTQTFTARRSRRVPFQPMQLQPNYITGDRRPVSAASTAVRYSLLLNHSVT
jgi:hypothetical protein